MSLFYLSFCDSERPKGTQFLGACLVEASNKYEAVPEAWRQGCNPGGEVVLFEMPKDKEYMVPPEYRNKLLDRVTLDHLASSEKSRHGRRTAS